MCSATSARGSEAFQLVRKQGGNQVGMTRPEYEMEKYLLQIELLFDCSWYSGNPRQRRNS
jgi:hypothetical protein